MSAIDSLIAAPEVLSIEDGSPTYSSANVDSSVPTKAKSKRALAAEAKAEAKEILRVAAANTAKETLEAEVLRIVNEGGFSKKGKGRKTSSLPKKKGLKRKVTNLEDWSNNLSEDVNDNLGDMEENSPKDGDWQEDKESFEMRQDEAFAEELQRRDQRETDDLKNVDADRRRKVEALAAVIHRRAVENKRSNPSGPHLNLWPLATEMDEAMNVASGGYTSTNDSSDLFAATVAKVQSAAMSRLAIFKDLSIGPAKELKCGCLFVVLPEDDRTDTDIVDIYQIVFDIADRDVMRFGKRVVTSRGHKTSLMNKMAEKFIDNITFEPEDILCTLPDGGLQAVLLLTNIMCWASQSEWDHPINFRDKKSRSKDSNDGGDGSKSYSGNSFGKVAGVVPGTGDSGKGAGGGGYTRGSSGMVAGVGPSAGVLGKNISAAKGIEKLISRFASVPDATVSIKHSYAHYNWMYLVPKDIV